MKEPTMRDMTVCFLIRHTPADRVLLDFMKRGFAAGKYAGIGGRVEADETIRAAASRELYEETAILASYSDLQTMGAWLRYVIILRAVTTDVWFHTLCVQIHDWVQRTTRTALV